MQAVESVLVVSQPVREHAGDRDVEDDNIELDPTLPEEMGTTRCAGP